MYVSTTLYEKYKEMVKEAIFHKGCINFKNKEEMPLKIVKNLIADCAEIDLRVIRENQLKSRSKNP